MLIDLHAHAIPAEFPAAEGWPTMEPAGAGGERLFAFGPVRYTAQRDWFDAEQRLAAMAASGVTAEVISPFPPLLNYRLPARSGRDLGRWINGFIAGLCQAGPAGSSAWAPSRCRIPTWRRRSSARSRRPACPGSRSAPPSTGHRWPTTASAASSPRPSGCARPSSCTRPADPATIGRLPAAAVATFGMTTEIGLAAAAVITGGVAEKHPGLRLAFSHGAGGFPLMLPRANWFWGRTWNEEPPADPGAPGQPSPAAYARRFFYDALVFDRRALRYLIDMIGPGQLLVGSDFPAMPREEPAGRTLRSMGLPGPVLDQITWDNCFRFLGIDPPASQADI